MTNCDSSENLVHSRDNLELFCTMLFRAVLLCLALAPTATALVETSVLQSVVDLSVCEIGLTVPSIRAEAFLYSVDDLLPPGTNNEDNKRLSMNVASQNSVLLIESPEDVGVAVYSGFETGDWLLWDAPGN